MKYAICFVSIVFLLFGFTACNRTGGKSEEPVPAEPAPASDKAVQLSLYVMSDCPYGKPAEKMALKVRGIFQSALSVRLLFIVNQQPSGELTSMHGPEELQKDILQACAGKVNAAQQLDFIVQMNESNKNWKEIAGQLTIDADAVQKCIDDGSGKNLILAHSQETKALNVHASPTMIINGTPYKGGTNSRELFDAVCKAFDPKNAPPVCANPPETLSRTDGSASGSCASGGAEAPLPKEMVDETPFVHTVLYDPAALDSGRMDEILAQTLKVFPKVKVEKVDANTAEGKKLIKKYQLTVLPAFIFPGNLDQRGNFKFMQQFLRKVDDAYLLDAQVAGNEFLQRPRQPKTIDIFFSPFSARALRLLLDLHDLMNRPDVQAMGLKINLRPFAALEAGNSLTSNAGPAEIEEMLRMLAIVDLKADKLWPYLQARAEDPQSSWWEDYVAKIGLDPKKIKDSAKSDPIREKLLANSKLAQEFNLAEDINFVFENRELARVDGKDALYNVLLKMAKK